jgi:dipeptidyl aminopeptidase/acylaminoacyl peptidase/roadblock/LC7 domain-containing protein
MRLLRMVMMLLAFSCGRDVVAQAVVPLEIEDVLEVWGFHMQGLSYTISPDGELVAYTACNPGAPEGVTLHGRGCVLFVTGTTPGATARRVLDGPGMTWGPSWSPDGRLLAFYSDRDGVAKAWLWDRATGVSRLLSDAPARSYYGYELAMWTPDGGTMIMHWPARGVAIASDDPPQEPAADYVAAAVTVSVFTSPADPAAANTPAAASDAPGADLVAVDVRTGVVRRLVTDMRLSRNGWLSPDGSSVAFLAAAPAASPEVQNRYHLHVVDVATGTVREVSPATTQWFSVQVSWSPDSRTLAYALAAAPGQESDGTPAGRAVFLSRVDGEPPMVLRGAYTSPLWMAAGDELLMIQTAPRRQLVRYSPATGATASVPWQLTETLLGVVSEAGGNAVAVSEGGSWITVRTSDPSTRGNSLFRLNVQTGETMRVAGGDGLMLSAPDVAADGRRMVYIVNSAAQSGDLWLSDGSSTRRITTLNPQLDRYRLGQSRLIDFRSADNRDLRAALLLPPDYSEGTRYPVVVWVYASEFGSRYVHSFGLTDEPAFNMQMLATRGYAVLIPDMPVSTGTPLADMMKTVMPAIDRLIDLGIADPDRLAVMGQSNGGYSVLGLIAQTGRFRAAVMNAGFGNLAALYGTMSASGRAAPWASWLEAQGGAMGAPPWEAPLRYVENSPVFYLDRVTTPLLMQAGTDDDVFTRQSNEIWVGLQRLGRNVTYLRYGGEGHVLRTVDNLADYWRRVVGFLAEHMPAPD